MPILRDPECPAGADVLIMESTYGDRLHAPIEEMHTQLAAILARVHARGGKVVIPSFALERAQEIVLALKGLERHGLMPPMPVYVDSPLTVKITDVFRLHPECFDEGARALVSGDESPFDFSGLRYVSSTDDSKAIDADSGPSIIISASGMCEAGRVLHHLKATIEDPRNAVLIVGFQAAHTLGRRLVEHRPRVKIFGVERDVRAEVVVMNGFSAHADQADLVAFAGAARDAGRLRRVLLVHGEPGPQQTLADLLYTRLALQVQIPAAGDVVTV
jgi:metallo-beta-lactamase family protein